jgi:hypothetical protein
MATKKNKGPGTDGIPFEFYLKFWDVIGVHFLEMMNCVLDKRKFQPSQGRAASSRLVPNIPTPSKITDYRPISLLTTDYKLIVLYITQQQIAEYHNYSKNIPTR